MNGLKKPSLGMFVAWTLLLPGWSLQGQTADSILNEVSLYASQVQDFEAEFLYELQTPNRRSLQKRGRMFYFAHPTDAHWYSLLMGDQEIYVDGNTQWIYFPEKNEVYIYEYILGGANVMELIFQMYNHKIATDYVGDKPINGQLCEQIWVQMEASPKVVFPEVYAWVGKQQRMFQKVTFLGERQNSTNIEFSNIQTNVGVTRSDFQFDLSKYPGIQVTDMR